MKKNKEASQTRKKLFEDILSKENFGSLERFNKNKKQKKMIICSIVGMLAILGAITLYRTYALYTC